MEWKEALWGKYLTGAPRPPKEDRQLSRTVQLKLASLLPAKASHCVCMRNKRFPTPTAEIPVEASIGRHHSVPTTLLTVTARLLPRWLSLEAGGEFGVIDEVIEEFVPGLDRAARISEHVAQFFDAVVG